MFYNSYIKFTRGTAQGVEAEDIVLLINCTSTEKLLGTDISATNHGLQFLRVNMKMKYSGCLSGMFGKQCGFKRHSDSRLRRLAHRRYAHIACLMLLACTVQ